jgi:hypothetical protein
MLATLLPTINNTKLKFSSIFGDKDFRLNSLVVLMPLSDKKKKRVWGRYCRCYGNKLTWLYVDFCECCQSTNFQNGGANYLKVISLVYFVKKKPTRNKALDERQADI